MIIVWIRESVAWKLKQIGKRVMKYEYWESLGNVANLSNSQVSWSEMCKLVLVELIRKYNYEVLKDKLEL